MIDFLKTVELDNLLCVLLLGVLAITSMFATADDNTLAMNIGTGLIGYLSKSAIIGGKK